MLDQISLKQQKELTSLLKELGAVDAQRRQLLNKIKSNTYYGKKYIEDCIKPLIEKSKDFSDKLFFNISKLDNKFTKNDIEKVFRIKEILDINNGVSGMFNVIFSTETITGEIKNYQLRVSILKPIIPQILQSAKELTVAEIKSIKKHIDTFNETQKNIAEIATIQLEMAMLTKKLETLNKKVKI